ncbi:hypothetical protein L3073_06005 [Ancylomarina sp. DW003]|nr:zincin-like metallopeptidase domain-containing protein [Ancylomarina sp. DW003]MDE5421754.1 hypothetical protein [Ancylomarina sp. DW003]
MLGLTNREVEKPTKKANSKAQYRFLKGILESSLDGWKDDKEKFKTDLINDIKSFLFSKWKKEWKPCLVFDENGKLLNGFRNINGRVYKNVSNVMTLAMNSHRNPFFITLSHLKKEGGKIVDENKVIQIVSYIPMRKDKGKKSGKPDYFLPKFHQAVNLDYVSGIEKPEIKEVPFKHAEMLTYVDRFIEFLSKKKRIPKIKHDQSDSNLYRHTRGSYANECIHMVQAGGFKKLQAYYSTLFHEIVHSTGNPKRLGRGKLSARQSLDYANEELVAEIGSLMLCEELGLEYNRQNSLSYLKGWLSQTKHVDTALLEAYSYASDAVEYLLEGAKIGNFVSDSQRERATKPEPKQTKKKTATKKPVKRKKPLKPKNKDPEKQTGKKTAKQSTIPFVDGLQNESQVSMPKGEGTTLLNNWKPNTEILPLRSDLGAFMGGYERKKYAVVLRGEKGAGKSRLLFQAINLFAWEGLKCLMLSLEMSPESSLFGEYLKYIEGKARNNVAISANNSIDQLEKYCQMYDVIAVDSWGKLQNSNQRLLDELMNKYPHVIWLIIFQSTTAGTARGGLGSEYDGSMVIQVAKGGNAQCEKNRYNSTDLVYNVFQQELIQTEDET